MVAAYRFFGRWLLDSCATISAAKHIWDILQFTVTVNYNFYWVFMDDFRNVLPIPLNLPNLFQKKCESSTYHYKGAAVFRPPLHCTGPAQSNFTLANRGSIQSNVWAARVDDLIRDVAFG